MKRLSLKQKVRNMRIQEIRMIQRIKKNKKNKKNCRTGEEQLRTIITLPMPPFITIFLNKNRTKLLKVTNKLRDYYFRKNICMKLDFSETKKMFTEGTLYLLAELETLKVTNPDILAIKGLGQFEQHDQYLCRPDHHLQRVVILPAPERLGSSRQRDVPAPSPE